MWLNVCNVNVLYMNMLSRFLKRHGSNGVSNLYSGWREFDFLWFDQWPLVVLGAHRYSNQHQRYSGMTSHIGYTEYTLASNVLGRWKHLCWCSLLNQQYLIVGQMCLVCIWFVCETCKDIATLIPAWTLNSMLCKQIEPFVLMPNKISKSWKSYYILAICTGNHHVHTDEDICAELYHQW